MKFRNGAWLWEEGVRAACLKRVTEHRIEGESPQVSDEEDWPPAPKNQAEWTAATDPITSIVTQLSGLGMTPERADTCLADESLGRSVVGEAKAGRDSFQIGATPTFIVNGRKLEGVHAPADIEAALATP